MPADAERAPLRAWQRAFDALPATDGRTLLDLGCGAGDQAAALAARGAHVVAVDSNEELVRAVRGRRLAGVDARVCDLRALAELGVEADGIWSSYAAAYLTDLAAALASWRACLRPGGWIALLEIDDFLGHEPVSAATRGLLDAYARGALAAGRYDFHMGRKLRGHLERAGFTVAEELTLEDPELAFDGPASPQVVAAWRARLARMRLLHEHCGADYARVRDELLGCMQRADHRSRATVRFCLATR